MLFKFLKPFSFLHPNDSVPQGICTPTPSFPGKGRNALTSGSGLLNNTHTHPHTHTHKLPLDPDTQAPGDATWTSLLRCSAAFHPQVAAAGSEAGLPAGYRSRGSALGRRSRPGTGASTSRNPHPAGTAPEAKILECGNCLRSSHSSSENKHL